MKVRTDHDLAEEAYALLRNPETHLHSSQTRILKQDATASVCLIHHRYVLKCYKARTKKSAVKNCLRRSRAYKCWRNGRLLRSYNIFTPKPLGYAESYFGPSYLLYEYVKGMNVWELFQQQGSIADQQAEALVKMITQLKQHRISFGDMKATNFVFSHNDPYMIDIHPVKQHTVTYIFVRKHQRDVARFMHCWRHHPREKALFYELFKHYGIEIPPSENYRFPDA